MRTRYIFYGSLVMLFLTAWGRAAIYYLNHNEIQELSKTSPMVADNNRQFLINSYDPLNISWIAAPVIIVGLVFVTLFLECGHWSLIWVTGTIGSVLFATGFLFPTTPLSRILAALFLAALTAVVYCAVAQADKVTSPRRTAWRGVGA